MNISVVITTYNYGSFVRESINSVLCQTYKNFELIIVDDGSEDGTKEIVSEYTSDARVKYFYQDNAGQPKAKNRGIRESCGEIIAFLDADDIWMPTKLEKQLALFDDPEVGVVYSRRKWINPDGVVISGDERKLRRGKILDYIFIDNFVCFSSSVIRRTYLMQVGYFDESLPMGIDYDLWIRLSSICKFDYVDEPLVKYRTGHSNLSKNTLKRYDCTKIIMEKNISNFLIYNNMAWYTPRRGWARLWSSCAFYVSNEGQLYDSFVFILKALFAFPCDKIVIKRFVKILFKICRVDYKNYIRK